jgi:hypothetical protein
VIPTILCASNLKRMKRALFLAGVSTAAVLLAGCSGTSGGNSGTSPAPSPAATQPSALSGFLCGANDDGVWRGKARLTNVGSTTNTYTVRFSVVRSDGGQVLGMKEATYTLKPGTSTDAALANIHSGAGAGLECVARVNAEPASSPAPEGTGY